MFKNVKLGDLMAETLELVGLRNSHNIVKAGVMELPGADPKRSVKTSERIEVELAMSALSR